MKPADMTSLGLCLAALISIALVQPQARAAKNYEPVYTTGEIERGVVNSSALAAVLGEVRANAADFIWIKTELYSHRGLRFKPHKDKAANLDASEVRKNSGGVKSHDDDTSPGQEAGVPEAVHADEHDEENHEDEYEDHDHEDHAHDDHEHAGHKHGTVAQWIPSEDSDFRGFIGTIQREVQPYGKHEFAQGSQILPWYRIQTAINPQQARAYVVAGWLLMKDTKEANHLEQAEKFLLEGAENNPGYFAIRVMLGRVYLAQEKFELAIEQFRLARDLALKRRTPDGKASPPGWEDSDEEDFGFAVRYIPYIYLRKLNDLAAAEKSTRVGLKLLPRDQPLQNFMRQIRRAKNEPKADTKSDNPDAP